MANFMVNHDPLYVVFVLLLYTLLWFALVPVGLYFHEAGHALAAWALGLRVLRVRLGKGRAIFKGSWRGTRLEVKAIPDSGATFVTFPDLRRPRLKLFL